jgi:hypothetical protein
MFSAKKDGKTGYERSGYEAHGRPRAWAAGTRLASEGAFLGSPDAGNDPWCRSRKVHARQPWKERRNFGTLPAPHTERPAERLCESSTPTTVSAPSDCSDPRCMCGGASAWANPVTERRTYGSLGQVQGLVSQSANRRVHRPERPAAGEKAREARPCALPLSDTGLIADVCLQNLCSVGARKTHLNVA